MCKFGSKCDFWTCYFLVRFFNLHFFGASFKNCSDWASLSYITCQLSFLSTSTQHRHNHLSHPQPQQPMWSAYLHHGVKITTLLWYLLPPPPWRGGPWPSRSQRCADWGLQLRWHRQLQWCRREGWQQKNCNDYYDNNDYYNDRQRGRGSGGGTRRTRWCSRRRPRPHSN